MIKEIMRYEERHAFLLSGREEPTGKYYCCLLCKDWGLTNGNWCRRSDVLRAVGCGVTAAISWSSGIDRLQQSNAGVHTSLCPSSLSADIVSWGVCSKLLNKDIHLNTSGVVEVKNGGGTSGDVQN